jgi:hypothetical protein
MRDARNVSNHLAALTVAATALSSPVRAALAQDLEPPLHERAARHQFPRRGVRLLEGNVLFDPPSRSTTRRSRSTDPCSVTDAPSARPFSGKIDGAIARVCLDGSADYEERARHAQCLRPDRRARPRDRELHRCAAARAAEFAGYRQDWVFGASLQMGLPVGDYDPARLVNIGANRVSAELEVGVSKNLEHWLLEVSLADTSYEDNTNFIGGRLASRSRSRRCRGTPSIGSPRASGSRSTRRVTTAARRRPTVCAAAIYSRTRVSGSRRRCRSTRSSP